MTGNEMKHKIKRLIRCLSKDYTELNNLRLPKRRSNQGLSDNTIYLKETESQIDELKKYAPEEALKILDFGSGQGRLLNGLIYTNTNFEEYVGIDIDADSVEWCLRNLKYEKNISFVWYNQINARYNPAGKPVESLPIKNSSYNIIFANSVFSHLTESDARRFAKLLRKAISDTGVFYLTAFTEVDVPNVEENPDGYMGAFNDTSPLHRVRFDKDYFIDIFQSEGWVLCSYHQNGIERTGQSTILLKPR
jgi:SAM-dependent methyltransferase